MARVQHSSAHRKTHSSPKPSSKPTKPVKTADTAATKATAGVETVKTVTTKKDDYGKVPNVEVPKTGTQDAVAPAMTRAFYTLAKTLESEEAAGPLAQAALREFAKSPEAMAAFKQAMPYLESGAVAVGTKLGAPQIGKLATSTLPLLANGQTVKALLKAGAEVGGPNGRRLVGAAIRGLNSGKGMAGAAAELGATAAKVAAKAPALGAAAGGVAKALPVIGNAANVIAVGASLKALYDGVRDPAMTKSHVLSRVMHLAATITGCFIPPAALVAAAIDVKQAVT